MKKIISTILILVFMLSFTAAAAPVEEFHMAESVARDLKELNLFQGVSEGNFDLDRAPTRTEALVMLIRLLGKEKAALDGNYKHPFKDVPAWADKYVGYAYANGLTKGVSATEFGTSNANCNMYVTFILRALGFSDTNGRDFTWNNPYDCAYNCGLSLINVDRENFMRSDVALISYAALSATTYDQDHLSNKLITAGVFSSEKFLSVYDILKTTSAEENFEYNRRLRDFLLTYGEAIPYSIGTQILEDYAISLTSVDGKYFYTLKYVPYTGYLYAEEALTEDNMKNYVSSSLYFASRENTADEMTISFIVNDLGTEIYSKHFIKPSNYTTESEIILPKWDPINIASDFYTKENTEGVVSIQIKDIIETTQLILVEEKLGFTLVDMGFKSFFK